MQPNWKEVTEKIKKNPIIFGYIFALGATAIWSGNFIIARGMSTEISPISLAFWRWVVATLAFLPFGAKSVINHWPTLKKHVGYITITSFLGVTLFNTMLYQAGKTTTAINLSLLSITFPIFIVIISRFVFKEMLTLKKVIGIVIVAFGVVFMITKGQLHLLTEITFAQGDLWMVGGALVFAIYSILLKRKPLEIPTKALQMSTFALGLIMLLPFYLINLYFTPAVSYNADTVGAIMYIGIFASLIAFIIWNQAIVNIGPSNAGMVYYTLPIFSGILAYSFLNEIITSNHLISAALIISGIVITNARFRRIIR